MKEAKRYMSNADVPALKFCRGGILREVLSGVVPHLQGTLQSYSICVTGAVRRIDLAQTNACIFNMVGNHMIITNTESAAYTGWSATCQC